MTLQAGVGKETEPSLSKTGETPDFHSPGCAPCFAVLWGPPGRSLEHWLAGAGKHISISSTKEPGGVQAKGVARKGKLPRVPGLCSVSTVDRVPFIRFTELTSAGPFHRLEKVHLSCLSKGRGSFGGCGHR